MSTATETTNTTTSQDFETVFSVEHGGYVIQCTDGTLLTRPSTGAVLVYNSPNGARKRISRVRRGNFHN